MPSPARKLPLYAPASRAAFECTACGACCTAGWGIAVDRATHQRLGRLLTGGDHARRFSIDACINRREKPTDLEYGTLAQANGQCVFLDADKLCYLHKHFGEASKPIACRSFPSKAATRAPGGRYLAPSFGCAGMLASLRRTAGDLALVRDPEQLEWNPGQATSRLGPSDFAAFDGRRSGGFDGTGFEQLMTSLRQILALPGATAESRVLAARIWLGDLGRQPRWLDAKAVRDSVDAVTSDGGETLAACAAAVGRGDRQVRMSVLQAVMNRRLALGALRPQSVARFQSVVRRYAFANATLEESAARFAVDVEAVYRPQQRALMPLVLSYLADKLFYSSEYLRVGVVPGFHAVLCLYALVRLFAIADAAEREAPLDESTLLRAIELVELQFGHAVHLFDFWSGSENMATLGLPFAAALLDA